MMKKTFEHCTNSANNYPSDYRVTVSESCVNTSVKLQPNYNKKKQHILDDKNLYPM